DRVSGAEHHVVRACPTHHRLVEVVGHGKVVGEELQVWSVTLKHVVKAHRGGAFFGGGVVEAGGLGEAVSSSTDCVLDPGEQVAPASAGIRACGIGRIAIKLLPHLVEAVDGAVVVGIVGVSRGGQLERAGGQSGCVGHAGVDIAVV